MVRPHTTHGVEECMLGARKDHFPCLLPIGLLHIDIWSGIVEHSFVPQAISWGHTLSLPVIFCTQSDHWYCQIKCFVCIFIGQSGFIDIHI